MSMELEQPNTDVSVSEVSSEPQHETANNQSAAPDAQAPEQQSEEKPAPFHEHPRFRELISEKNQLSDTVKALQNKLEQFERSSRPQQAQPQTQAEKDALIERLKQIDPELGGRFETLNEKMAKMEQLEQKLANYERQSSYEKAMAQVQAMHSEFKVPKEAQARYERQLRALAAEDPSITLSDVPKLYKQIHEEESKYWEARERSLRESYVTDKKKDSSIPATQAKAKAPQNVAKKQAPRNQEESKQETVQEILNQLRGNRDI